MKMLKFRTTNYNLLFDASQTKESFELKIIEEIRSFR